MLSTPPPSFHSSDLISIPVTPPPGFQQSARDVISWDLRASQLHDSVRVPAHGKPPFACAPNLPLSLSLSKISQTRDRIDFVSRSTVEFENLEGIEEHEDRWEESRSIACQRENRWSVKRATNNFLLGKPSPRVRGTVSRVDLPNKREVANGVRRELGKVRIDLHRVIVEASRNRKFFE